MLFGSLFWIVAAAMVTIVVVIVTWPLLRPPTADLGTVYGTDCDYVIWRDQLAEVDYDRDCGLVTLDDEEAVRNEIARRMLAIPNQDSDHSALLPLQPAYSLAVALALLLPLITFSIYLFTGSPDIKSSPWVAPSPAEREATRALIIEIEQLQQHLISHPNDGSSWVSLAQRQERLGQWPEAADSWGYAAEHLPNKPAILTAWGEAITNASNGIVTVKAIQIFESVLALHSNDPRCQYYLALARNQAGDDIGALARWQALLQQAPANAPWVVAVRNRLTETAERLGLTPKEIMPDLLPISRDNNLKTETSDDDNLANKS
jgi:cytochrome c-type biogenesis protein CcmH